jgi:ATP-dependent Lon protease
MNKAPFIPVKEVVFPGVITTIFVGRDKSIKSLESALLGGNKIILFLQRDVDAEIVDIPSGINRVGVLVTVVQTTKLPDGIVRVLLEAEKRVKLLNIVSGTPGYAAEYEFVSEEYNIEDLEIEAIKRKILDSFEEYLRLSNKISSELVLSIRSIKNINRLLDLIASNVNISTEQKQDILEISSVKDRSLKILNIINEEIEVINIEQSIDSKVKDQMTSMQKNIYLKEKMRIIRDELGGDEEDEIDFLKDQIDSLKADKNTKKKLDQELNKLMKMPPYSSEFSVIRGYIDTILSLPWNKFTKDILNIKKASEILEKNHYGLEEVKDRILEYLAVKQLNQNLKGSILCLAGPPGVGKTSLCRSIASTLGRKFARISLGGIDEAAVLRGHKKTYVGAMPGRIIKEIKHVDTMNPVILLDEIDKMVQNFRGDPASALLEILDPEQNKEFIDNYLEIPFDLSNVFFIATANDISHIPLALRDRLEIIDINSYTETEKLHIAKKYLVSQSKEESGLKKADITVTDKTILKIIDEYTREAGVRNLKREIDKLFRRLAKKSLEKKLGKLVINSKNLERYLDKPKYIKDKQKKKEGKIGIVNGLAWTSIGGCTMDIQATLLPGKHDLITTGALGDVMKESTQVALSYVQAHSDILGISNTKFSKEHLHLHFPEAATPKDGPSAGIAITTAIISILSKKHVRQDIAMTGEVTITGEVLAIGGVKEKVIGAHRVGIREVILPLDNKNDVHKLPKDIKKSMKIHFASDYLKDVLDRVFVKYR